MGLIESKQRYQSLERSLKEALQSYFFELEPTNERWVIDTNRVSSPELPIATSGGHLHNYQRDLLESNYSLKISYDGATLAYLDRYPKRQVRLAVRKEFHPKQHFALKVLERVLFYNFNELEVIRHE